MQLFDNPNVVKIEEYLETANSCYIVMEFCNNGDLETYINKLKYINLFLLNLWIFSFKKFILPKLI